MTKESDNPITKSNLLQLLMSQQLLVVGDTHEEDEAGHLVESIATMNVVYHYIAVLHDSGYSFRLWLESGNQYANELTELGYQVLHLPLKSIRKEINNDWFEIVANTYEKIRKYAFEENPNNNKKSGLIRHVLSTFNDEEIQNIKDWIKEYNISIEEEAEAICTSEKPEDCIDIIVIGNIHAHLLSMKGYATLHVNDESKFMEFAFINKIIKEFV